MKGENSDEPRFQYKVIVFFSHTTKNPFQTLYQSSEDMKNTYLAKLLGQFIELYNAQCFQRLENLRLILRLYCSLFLYNILKNVD